MTRPTTILLLGAGILGALAFAVPAARAAGIPADAVTARAAATSLVIDVRHHRGHRHVPYGQRPQLLVQPYPQTRGFHDPGFAYHGNINGCVVDLGYGRYEPCD